MLEPRRSRYLRALGIDVYVPRRILPGARPSPACEWEAAEPAADVIIAAEGVPLHMAVDAPAASPAAALSGPAGELQHRLAEELQQPPAPRRIDAALKPAVDAIAAKSNTATSAPPRIALSTAVGAGGFLIVDDAPASAGERGEYLRLLANILFALRGDGAAPALDVFLWPLSKQPQLDHGAAAARETLAAYIQAHVERHAVHTVLLLGDAAQQWCAVDGEGLRRVASVSALGCLRAPEQKRRLWSDIRHLAVVH